MLASDPAIVSVLGRDDPTSQMAALARLQMLTRTCRYYLNAFLVDAKGRPMLSADPQTHIFRYNLAKASQFNLAMRSQAPGEWLCDEVWANPDAGGKVMLVYAAGVWYEGASKAGGVL